MANRDTAQKWCENCQSNVDTLHEDSSSCAGCHGTVEPYQEFRKTNFGLAASGRGEPKQSERERLKSAAMPPAASPAPSLSRSRLRLAASTIERLLELVGVPKSL